MNSTLRWLAPLSLSLALMGCGGGNKSAEEKPAETSSAPAAAPAAAVDPAQAAEVTGKIAFEGTAPSKVRIKMDAVPACTEASKEPVYSEEVVVNENKTLKNVFVYVKDGLTGSFPAPSEPVLIDQKGCWYHPHVLGVMAGQKLDIKNSDPTNHNIHPMPAANREFNQSQPPGSADLMQEFARPEIMIPVKCNVHPWMKAYIGVTSNPFFAVSDDKGSFTIKGLPPGTYTITAWQEKYGSQDQKVTVGPKESKAVDFNFKG